jgi:hypothetical protein
MRSKAIELYCDIIAVALVFITVRRDELVNPSTRMTPNESKLNDNMTIASLSVGWGGEDDSQPHPNLRHSYSQATFTSLRQIANFNVNEAAKINEVREIIKTQMRRFWTQCYGIDTTNADGLGGLARFPRVEILPAYRCAGGALP